MDSHHIDEIKGYAKTATETHAALEKQGVHVTRNRPDLLWWGCARRAQSTHRLGTVRSTLLTLFEIQAWQVRHIAWEE